MLTKQAAVSEMLGKLRIFEQKHKLVVSQGARMGVPLTYVYPWYLFCSRMGFLGIIAHKYPRAIGLINREISHDGGPRWDRGTSNELP